jgi:hypothetical protein
MVIEIRNIEISLVLVIDTPLLRTRRDSISVSRFLGSLDGFTVSDTYFQTEACLIVRLSYGKGDR